MNSLIARYTRATRYIWFALAAAAGFVFSGWMGLHWFPCFFAAALFALTGFVLGALAAQPPIEISAENLSIGRWTAPWTQIRQVDYSGWLVPLAIRLTLNNGGQKLLLFPGDKESGTALLRLVRRMSCEAQLDGLTYREFWGDVPRLRTSPANKTPAKTLPLGGSTPGAVNEAVDAPPVRYPMLRPEDEREVEQMYQRLKSVGHLESRDAQE